MDVHFRKSTRCKEPVHHRPAPFPRESGSGENRKSMAPPCRKTKGAPKGQPKTMQSASSLSARQKASIESSAPEVIRRPPAAAIPPEFAEGRGGLPSLPNLNKER